MTFLIYCTEYITTTEIQQPCYHLAFNIYNRLNHLHTLILSAQTRVAPFYQLLESNLQTLLIHREVPLERLVTWGTFFFVTEIISVKQAPTHNQKQVGRPLLTSLITCTSVPQTGLCNTMTHKLTSCPTIIIH